MATELGKAYVQIVPSAQGITGALQKELGGEATAAGKSSGNMIMTAIKGAITVAAIGKFLGASLTEGGALQQSLGGVETLFKENADKVKAYANEAYRTSGLSANKYMENVTGFSASLLQSLGGDTEKAAEKANTALIDMSDNANKMGTPMESIQTAYQGFAKQNYTMLDNLKLGYGGTKTEMERLLKDATKLTGVKYDINNLADVYDAIHVVQTELGITGTTARESAETLSGSLASMKSAFSNVMGNLSIGADLGPSLQALAQTVSTFLFGNFLPMITNILKTLPGAIVTFIQEAAPYFLQAGGQFISQLSSGVTNGLPSLITSVQSIVANIATMITEKLPEFLDKGVEIIGNIVSGILEALPQLIEGAGNMLSTFVQFIMTNLPTILASGKDLLLSLVDGIIKNLPAIADSAIKAASNFLDTIIANAPEFLKAGWGVMRDLISGIISRLPDIIKTVINIIAKFIEMIVSKLPDIAEAGMKILGSIVSGIGSVVEDLYKKATEIMGKVWDKIDEWKNRFFDAGRNIVNSIAEGIRGAMSSVTDAIGSVVQSIRDHLPFSPAKEGPLKDLNRLDFTIIAQGIYKAKNPIVTAMRDLAQSTLESYDAITGIKSNIDYRVFSNEASSEDYENNKRNGIVVNQYIYAKTEDERAQQKEAVRNLRQLLPQV